MLGNLSWLPKSTDSCQSCALLRSPDVALGVVLGFSPALMKLMAFFVGFDLRQLAMPLQMLSAMVLST